MAMKAAEIANEKAAAKTRFVVSVANIFGLLDWSFVFLRECFSRCPMLCRDRAKLEKRQNSAVLRVYKMKHFVHLSERLGIFTTYWDW